MNKKIISSLIIFLILGSVTTVLFAQTNKLSIGELAPVTDSRLMWDPLTESVVLEKTGYRISFRVLDSLALLVYSQIIITALPVVVNGVL